MHLKILNIKVVWKVVVCLLFIVFRSRWSNGQVFCSLNSITRFYKCAAPRQNIFILFYKFCFAVDVYFFIYFSLYFLWWWWCVVYIFVFIWSAVLLIPYLQSVYIFMIIVWYWRVFNVVILYVQVSKPINPFLDFSFHSSPAFAPLPPFPFLYIFLSVLHPTLQNYSFCFMSLPYSVYLVRLFLTQIRNKQGKR